MAISNKTIQYKIFSRDSGRAEEVSDTTSYKRPSLEMMSDTISGAGIMGEIDMPSLSQLGSMESEIALRRSHEKAAALFAPGTHELEIRWATDSIDTATGKVTTIGNKDIVKYYPKTFDIGSVENNTANESTLAMEVIYFHHISNGKSIIEIDKQNSVFKILGVDYAAGIREVL